uniref:GOLD domain-containing protein n=1 Tax=Compsopogon caeruleus TaxID=31354 RepID=A0A7S1XEX4_9RHOD
MVMELHKSLDRCMFNNRWQAEELAAVLRRDIPKVKESALEALSDASIIAAQVAKEFEIHQKGQREKVSKEVEKNLPQDLRITGLRMANERKEAKNRAAVESLMEHGGSVSDKYELLWQQQWERRKTLVDLGNATGIWRVVVKYVAGVPQVMLDFLKQINDPEGPNEEIRVKYGPNLYTLTKFIYRIHKTARAMVHYLKGSSDLEKVARSNAAASQILASVVLYDAEVKKYLALMTELNNKSPLFISTDTAWRVEKSVRDNTRISAQDLVDEEWESLQIPPRISHGVPIDVTVARTVIIFQARAPKDIRIGISADEEGTNWVLEPKIFCAAPGIMDHDHAQTLQAGTHFLIFDNSYSVMTRKIIEYRFTTVVPGVPNVLPRWAKELVEVGELAGARYTANAGEGAPPPKSDPVDIPEPPVQ